MQPTDADWLSTWFDQGVAINATHMLVLLDTVEQDTYAVYCKRGDGVWDRYRRPGSQQIVLEVYDLNADKAEQMAEERTMRLPPPPPPSLVVAAPETAAPLPVPAGWKLVPIAYTLQQMEVALAHAKLAQPAGNHRSRKVLAFDYCTGYRVMVEAAPPYTPPTS